MPFIGGIKWMEECSENAQKVGFSAESLRRLSHKTLLLLRIIMMIVMMLMMIVVTFTFTIMIMLRMMRMIKR